MARGLAGEPSPVGGRTPLLVFLGWDPARVRFRSPELSQSSGSLTFLIQNISHFQGNKKKIKQKSFLGHSTLPGLPWAGRAGGSDLHNLVPAGLQVTGSRV